MDFSGQPPIPPASTTAAAATTTTAAGFSPASGERGNRISLATKPAATMPPPQRRFVGTMAVPSYPEPVYADLDQLHKKPSPSSSPSPQSLMSAGPRVAFEVQHQYNQMIASHSSSHLLASFPAYMAPPPPPCANLSTLQTQPQPASINLGQQHNMPSPFPFPSPQSLVSTGLCLAMGVQNNMPLPFPSPSTQSLVPTGLRLAIGEQQQQHNQMTASSSSSSLLAYVSQRHGNELDRLLRHQNKQLHRGLTQLQAQCSRALLTVEARMKDKEAELELAVRRGAELEERITIMSNEVAAWQSRTLAGQEAVLDLQAQLQQALAAAQGDDQQHAEDDVAQADTASSAYVDHRGAKSDGSCWACWLMPATVLLLPCRHLCLCEACFAAGDVDASNGCPVCRCAWQNTMVVIFP